MYPHHEERGVSPQVSEPFGGLYLGCPQWSHRPWIKSIYPAESSPREALTHYARAFNAVEGNTTFYATPAREVVRRWAEQTSEDFKLVLKFPKTLTHERLLGAGALDEATRFLEHMSPLGARLTHTLIQLPARFDERGLDVLYGFLNALPRQTPEGHDRHYAVELRAPSLTVPSPDGRGLFEEVNALLSATETERVWMDTRPLREAPTPLSEATVSAQGKKPNLPVYPMGLGPSPMVRYVAHPIVEANRPWLNDWATVFATWLEEGRRPYFFAHYPGETLAPEVADLFYRLLREYLPSLPERPVWPSERQFSLF